MCFIPSLQLNTYRLQFSSLAPVLLGIPAGDLPLYPSSMTGTTPASSVANLACVRSWRGCDSPLGITPGITEGLALQCPRSWLLGYVRRATVKCIPPN